MQPNNQRIAVDSTAEDYWTKYFAPYGYGKMWVRKITRRVATVLVGRIAGLQSEEIAYRVAQARVVPVGSPVITEDRVCLEAAIAMPGDDGRMTRRIFNAEFDHDGRLLMLDSIPISA